MLALILFLSLHARAEDCAPKSPAELLSCAEAHSPELRLNSSKLESARGLEDAASQWTNPQLDVEALRKDGENSETTAALLFTLPLGGKRGALKAEAAAEALKARAESELDSAELKLNLLLKLYRLSHLESEIAVLEESVSTFNKIIAQYSSKASLPPEQEVSAAVFRMAADEHGLTLTKLKNSEKELLAEVTRQTGASRENILKSLPPRRASWPELKEAGVSGASPASRLAEAELKLARSQSEKAAADAWPDLTLGPAFKAQQTAGVTENFAGVSLSLPLPVLTLNSGEKAYRRVRVSSAELELNNENAKAREMRPVLAERYASLVRSLRNAPERKITEERHAKIEKLFFRGLVPGPLVIEAHRQIFDLEEKINATEMEALETLGRISILDNTEVNL